MHHCVESIFSNDDQLGHVSLTSKYLHFHRPDLFPIYDSRTSTAIAQITPDSRFSGYEVSSEHATLLYGKFTVRAAWLLDRMAEVLNKYTPKLRQLDDSCSLHRDTGETTKGKDEDEGQNNVDGPRRGWWQIL